MKSIIWVFWIAHATSDMWTHTGTPGQASSPPPARMDEKMETVLFQLRHVTRERDELRKRLALSSPGTTFDDCRYCFTLHLFLKQTSMQTRSDPVYTCVNRGILPASAVRCKKHCKTMGKQSTLMIFLFPCVFVSTSLCHVYLSIASVVSPCHLKPIFRLPLCLGNRPNSKAGHDYERLKLQCMKAMADLQSLQNQHSSTLKRCEEAVKKADFYQWVEKPTTGHFCKFFNSLHIFALCICKSACRVLAAVQFVLWRIHSRFHRTDFIFVRVIGMNPLYQSESQWVKPWKNSDRPSST